MQMAWAVDGTGNFNNERSLPETRILVLSKVLFAHLLLEDFS